jgi:hypothetical protein
MLEEEELRDSILFVLFANNIEQARPKGCLEWLWLHNKLVMPWVYQKAGIDNGLFKQKRQHCRGEGLFESFDWLLLLLYQCS